MASTGKIIGKSIKALFYFIIVLINAIVLWRILFSGDPSSLKPLMANENTVAAYKIYGDGLRLETQKQRTITESGKFSVTECVFIPEAQQIQVTVRYNNSTLRYLANDYELEATPDRKNDVFDVTIVKTIDLTPDNDKDNADKGALREERYYPSEVKTAYKTLYSYRKFIFDGVNYEDAVGMFVDFYYIEDVDYGDTPYDALCIYDASMPLSERKFTRADRNAIKKSAD